jgi:hypothetical protein
MLHTARVIPPKQWQNTDWQRIRPHPSFVSVTSESCHGASIGGHTCRGDPRSHRSELGAMLRNRKPMLH